VEITQYRRDDDRKSEEPRDRRVAIIFCAPTDVAGGVREKRTTVCCGGGYESFTDNIAGCGAAGDERSGGSGGPRRLRV